MVLLEVTDNIRKAIIRYNELILMEVDNDAVFHEKVSEEAHAQNVSKPLKRPDEIDPVNAEDTDTPSAEDKDSLSTDSPVQAIISATVSQAAPHTPETYASSTDQVHSPTHDPTHDTHDDSHSNLVALDPDSPSIDHSVLIKVSKRLSSDTNISVPLWNLLRGSGVYIPPKPVPAPKSPEYLKTMEKLRLQLQEQEYQELIGRDQQSLDDNKEYISPSLAAKQVKEQLTTIFNIFLSCVSVGYALWYWTGSYGWWSLASRTLLALFGGLIVLIAEVVVYLRYLNKIEDARHKEVIKKEKKTVVSSVEYRSLGVGKVIVTENQKMLEDNTGLRKRK